MNQIKLETIYGNRIRVEVMNPFYVKETMDERLKRMNTPPAIIAPEASRPIEMPDSAIQKLQYRVCRVLQVGNGTAMPPEIKVGKTLLCQKLGSLQLLDNTLVISADDVIAEFPE